MRKETQREKTVELKAILINLLLDLDEVRTLDHTRINGSCNQPSNAGASHERPNDGGGTVADNVRRVADGRPDRHQQHGALRAANGEWART